MSEIQTHDLKSATIQAIKYENMDCLRRNPKLSCWLREIALRIVNISRHCVLADRADEALTFGKRLWGLLGREQLGPGEGLVIRPCTSIHSFFMKFRFDAAFVDHAGRVVHVIRSMKPFRISRVVPKAAGVVELPEGVLAATGTKVGDRLEFV